jgi:putative transposase
VSQCRTFRFRIYPTYKQAIALDRVLWLQRELYNAALEARRGAWRWEQRSVSFFQQCRILTELREVRPEVLEFGVTVCRGTLTRLDRAYKNFFRRCQRGEKPGYPRFKSRSRFNSLQWEYTNGWKLKVDARRLYLQGIGDVKVPAPRGQGHAKGHHGHARGSTVVRLDPLRRRRANSLGVDRPRGGDRPRCREPRGDL